MDQKRHMVIGLGQSGLSVCVHLHQLGMPFVVNDSRANPPGLAALQKQIPQAEIHLGTWRPDLISHCEHVVVSPGVSLNEPIITAAKVLGKPVSGDIQLFADVCQAPVVGITGTNGKSTVTTLVAELLQNAGFTAIAGGNLGKPALDLLQLPTPDVYVLELSSYQLESTHRLPLRVACVLNLSADHMDRYPSMTEYAAAKQRIFANAEVAVLNQDDKWVMAMQRPAQQTIYFSETNVESEFYVDTQSDPSRLMQCGREIATGQSLYLKGRHNQLNVLAAMAIVKPFEISETIVQQTVQSFKGLPHRSQLAAEFNGVKYINDSKGTNVGATVAAIRGANAPIILIAGGDGKGQDFSELAEVCRDHVKHVILIGRDAPIIAQALAGVSVVSHAPTLEQAVIMASQQASSGDWVLLSPACASLDMFSSYAERGDRFTQAARGLLS